MRHFLALALLVFALPTVGQAQLTVAVVSIDGETTMQEITRGVNSAHCESNAELVFRIGTTASPIRNVDVWHSDGTSSNCQAAADRSANLMDRQCVHVGTLATDDGELTFNVADLAAEAEQMCASDRTPHTFLFIQGNTEQNNELPAQSMWGSITVVFDSEAPSPPTVDRTEVSGSGNVPIGWESVAADNNGQVMRYQVYRLDGGCGSTSERDAGMSDAGPTGGMDAGVDDSGTDDAGTDDAGVDDAGMDDAGMDDAGMDGGVGSSSGALTAEGAIVTGTSANVPAPGAYVVRTVDFSNNESGDSETVCVIEVPTVGFCDVREGGCPDGCSAGSTRAGGLAAIFVFLGLLIARRRVLV